MVTQAHAAGLLRGALGTGPPLERIIWLLVAAQIVLQEVRAGGQPESTLHLAGCQKTNEQILPLSGCSLPSPHTCNLYRGCAWSEPEPLGQRLGWELGKNLTQQRKTQVKEVWSTARSHPACGAGPEHRAAGFPTPLSRHLPGEMSISSEHKPLGKQVTGSLHTVSKVQAQGHSFLLWDQRIPFGLC